MDNITQFVATLIFTTIAVIIGEKVYIWYKLKQDKELPVTLQNKNKED